MDVARTQMQLGPATLEGKEHDPIIQAYLRSVGLGKNDEANWCGAFVNWCLEQAGYTSLGTEGKGGRGARQWLKYGTPMTQPCPGAIVVFWRVKKHGAWEGHVAFYTHTAGSMVHVLGGNQGTGRQITYSSYKKSTVLGYRWPVVGRGGLWTC